MTDHLALVLVPARAGGGEGSNSGSGGGGGSPSVGVPGGGGGGGFPLLPLLGGSPVLVIIFVIGGAMLRARGQRTGGGPGSRPAPGDGPPPPPPPPPVRGVELEAGLAAIRAHDPAFDEPGLLDEATGIHTLVNRSWIQLDPESARSVLAEPLFSERKRTLEAKAARGEHPHSDDMHIGRSDIVASSTDGEAGTETVVVRIHAYARTYDLDSAGQLVSGDQVLRLWSEDWHFMRPTSEVTRRAAGTSKVCPRCGAPLSLKDDGTCAFCHAQVAAGASGWRVVEIRAVLS